MEGERAPWCSHVCCAICRAWEQRLAPWEPLPLTTKSLIWLRHYRASLVLRVHVGGIKVVLQKENSVFSLHGVIRWGKSPTLWANCTYFKSNTCTFGISEHRNNSSPHGLSLTCYLACSELSNHLTWGEAKVLPPIKGERRAAGCWVWGWSEVCVVSSLGPWGSTSEDQQALLHSRATGGLNGFLQQLFTEHRADQARIMDRRKGQVRLPKNIHLDPFFADARGLPFASPYARADLLVSLSAVCPPCFKTSEGPD